MKKRIQPKLNVIHEWVSWRERGWNSPTRQAIHLPGEVRRDKIMAEIRIHGNIYVNSEGQRKTYHGEFGRDVRKLIKQGKIKQTKHNIGDNYFGVMIRRTILVLA